MITTQQYVLLISAFITAIHGKAQQSVHLIESKKLQQMNFAMDGTYQIQVIDSRELPMFPLTILPEIDSVRKQNDTVYIKIKDHERIMVLPKSVITAPSFVKAEHLVYISDQ